MSEEKKNAKLNEEELEKVSGGGWGGSCVHYNKGVCTYPGGESQCPYGAPGENRECDLNMETEKQIISSGAGKIPDEINLIS